MEPLKFTIAINPKGGVLYIYRSHIVAVAPYWVAGSRGDVIEANRAVLHLEGGRHWTVEGSPQEVMLRIAQGGAA